MVIASVRKLHAGAIKNDALLVFANLADPLSTGGQSGRGQVGELRSALRLFLEQSSSGLLSLYVWCFYFSRAQTYHLTRMPAAHTHSWRPTYCILCAVRSSSCADPLRAAAITYSDNNCQSFKVPVHLLQVVYTYNTKKQEVSKTKHRATQHSNITNCCQYFLLCDQITEKLMSFPSASAILCLHGWTW